MKLITLLLLLGSCHPVSRPAGPGDSISVKKGGTFDISLAVNLGNGYSWSISDSAFSAFLSLDTQFVRTNVRDVDNGPEEQVFRFRALKKGTTQLHFRLRRPWRKEDPPLQEKEYQVTIH